MKLGEGAANDKDSAKSSVLALAYGWADAIGGRFAQLFRSAFVLNFIFAAVAVVVAVTSLLFDHDKKHLFVFIELLLIAVVLVNTVVGQWRAWHHRWFEPREVAERLRIAFVLWMLGARPTSFSGREPAWTGWYTRAICREQSPRSEALDEHGLAGARDVLLELLENQCAYHHNRTVQMGLMERRLERFGLLLFGATMIAALLFLSMASFVEASEMGAFALTALGAGLPALATASYGIRVIGDFEGIAHRSERTREALTQLIGAIKHDPLTLDRLRSRARGAAEAMLGDVSTWRIAAESRSLNIPG